MACSPEPVRLVGMLDDGPAGLGDAARGWLAGADLVVGSGRLLDRCAGWLKPGAESRDMGSDLAVLPQWIRAAREEGCSVAVLATGDPLCFGIGARLIDALGAEAVEVLPTVSTLQVACARLKRPWSGAFLVSVHGRDSGDWPADASGTPHHGLYPLLRAAAQHDRVLCLTSPANGPDRIARALLACGCGEEFRLSIACRLLRADEALFPDLTAADAAGRTFLDPNVVLLERVAPATGCALFGLDDAVYRPQAGSEGGGLVTKREVRAVALARLGLETASVVWDIGAGSGSVGFEAARLCAAGHVWAMEKDAARAAGIRANVRCLGVSNYTLQLGLAPAGLEGWPDPDAVFIGGSGGELPALIRRCLARLRPGGRLVMNFATLENLAIATGTLEDAGAPWDATQVSVARSRPILDQHRLAAENPVWIVTTCKEET